MARKTVTVVVSPELHRKVHIRAAKRGVPVSVELRAAMEASVRDIDLGEADADANIAER